MNPKEVKDLLEQGGELNQSFLGSHVSKLGVEEHVAVPDHKRLLHTLCVGPTGYGKTQSMLHTMLQDAYKDNGFAFINPKGKAIDKLLHRLPENRLDDVVYLNPSTEPVPGINVLEPFITEEMNEAQRQNQIEIIVSDLIDLFKRQSKNWGDRFGRILETLLRAHILPNIHEQGEEPNTLYDVFQCVVEPSQLKDVVNQLKDPVICEQLNRVRQDMGSYELEPLQRRLNDFLMFTSTRKIITAKHSSINFRDLMNNGDILLVDIQKGEIGEDPSQIIGSLLITKIWAAAQSRINQNLETTQPFYLYVDELQNFAGEGSNFNKILTEAREYRLGCWLNTQYLQQLPSDMRNSVTNNCRTKIIFQPDGSENIAQLNRLTKGIRKEELQTLGRYTAAIKTPTEHGENQAVTADTYPPYEPEHSRDIDQLKKRCSPEETDRTRLEPSLGTGANAGGKKHKELIAQAQQELETRSGIQVNPLTQIEGGDQPDGIVTLPDGSQAHLEAEHTTLSKPGKVLKNVRRAVQEEREIIFVVEQGNTSKLENIVTDPVNRRGSMHEDENGGYSYYTDSNGEPITDIDQLKQAEYRILEIDEEDVQLVDEPVEPECPMLDDNPEDELTEFCLHREDDRFCTELGQRCVLTE